MASRVATATFGWTLSTLRMKDFPWFPVGILCTIAAVAIFAEALAPHSPEVGSLGMRFKPPAWQQGGTSQFLHQFRSSHAILEKCCYCHETVGILLHQLIVRANAFWNIRPAIEVFNDDLSVRFA